MQTVANCCPACDDGEGNCMFPMYGVAPHDCYYKLGTPMGTSQEHPEHAWPANFQVDEEMGPATGFPRAGVYTHCLECGRPDNGAAFKPSQHIEIPGLLNRLTNLVAGTLHLN